MSHFISLKEAKDMTALYRNNRETILDPSYRGQDLLPLSETFDRAAIDTLLAQDGCASLRIYYGMNEDLQVHAVIVGVDEEGQDILPSSNNVTSNDGSIVDRSVRCPDICPPASDLNC